MTEPPPPPPFQNIPSFDDKVVKSEILESMKQITEIKNAHEPELYDRDLLKHAPTLAEAIKFKQQAKSKEILMSEFIFQPTFENPLESVEKNTKIKNVLESELYDEGLSKNNLTFADAIKVREHSKSKGSSEISKLTEGFDDFASIQSQSFNSISSRTTEQRIGLATSIQSSNSVLLTGPTIVPNNVSLPPPPPPPVFFESKKMIITDHPHLNQTISATNLTRQTSVTGESRKITPPPWAPPPPPPNYALPIKSSNLNSSSEQLQNLVVNLNIPSRNFDSRFKFVDFSLFPDPNMILKRPKQIQ